MATIQYIDLFPNMLKPRILMLILHLLKTKINKKTNLWHKPKKIKNKNKHQRRNSNKWNFPGFEQCHWGEPSLPKAKTIEGRPKMDNKHIIHQHNKKWGMLQLTKYIISNLYMYSCKYDVSKLNYVN